jgi:hypothetical protein
VNAGNAIRFGRRFGQGFSPFATAGNGIVAIFTVGLWAGRPDQDQTEQTMESSTMGLQQAKLESLPFVTAELNYLAPTPGKPRTTPSIRRRANPNPPRCPNPTMFRSSTRA